MAAVRCELVTRRRELNPREIEDLTCFKHQIIQNHNICCDLTHTLDKTGRLLNHKVTCLENLAACPIFS